MASSVNPLSSSPSAAANAASSASSASGLGSAAPSEGVFLQLLVSQLQNQDPLNPTDSTTFVTQLAQFSELEQVMAIRGDTDTLVTDAGQTSSAAAGSGTTANTNTDTTNAQPAAGTTTTGTNATNPTATN